MNSLSQSKCASITSSTPTLDSASLARSGESGSVVGLVNRSSGRWFFPASSWSLIAAIGLAALGLFVYANRFDPAERPAILLFLCGLILSVEWVPIPRNKASLQRSRAWIGATFAFAALVLLGPAGLIVARIAGGLAHVSGRDLGTGQAQQLSGRLIVVLTLASASAVAGLVYILAGGRVPFVFDARNLIAAGIAAGVCSICDGAVADGVLGVDTGWPSAFWAGWPAVGLGWVASLAAGLGMAVAYDQGLGAAGLAAVALLVVLPWYSTCLSVETTRQVSADVSRLVRTNAALETAQRALDLRDESLRALHDIAVSLNSAQSLESTARQILQAIVKLVRADASAIYLNSPIKQGSRLSIAGQVGLSDRYLAAPVASLDGGVPGMALNGGTHGVARHAGLQVVDGRRGSPATLSAAARQEGIRSVASFPLNVAGEIVGGLEVCYRSEHLFTEDELALLKPLAEDAALAIHNARLIERIHEAYLSTIRALAATVEAKDATTRGHSEEVRHLAIQTGRRMGLTEQQIEMLSLGALFHDLGKIGISDSILNKCGRLTDEEWRLVRQHPLIGEQILAKIPAMDEVRRITRHHHERFDGRGYPDGICARQDLLAAVIATCDAYQAMTSDRPYRRAYAPARAIHEIKRCAGTQFVPEVAEAFVAIVANPDRRSAERQDPHLSWVN